MITILGAFLFSYYFVNIAGFPSAIKKYFKMPFGARIKPLDCVTCLSVWSAVALYFMPNYVSEFIAVIFGAGFIGYLFSKQ